MHTRTVSTRSFVMTDTCPKKHGCNSSSDDGVVTSALSAASSPQSPSVPQSQEADNEGPQAGSSAQPQGIAVSGCNSHEQHIPGDSTAHLAADNITHSGDTPATSPSKTTATKSSIALERENFLIFIKILFKLLEDGQMKARAQRIVMECQRRNRLGDPTCTPLMEGIERRLRNFVGEAKWRRTHMLLHHYLVHRKPGAQSGGIGVNRQDQPQRPSAILAGK